MSRLLRDGAPCDTLTMQHLSYRLTHIVSNVYSKHIGAIYDLKPGACGVNIVRCFREFQDVSNASPGVLLFASASGAACFVSFVL